jgi:hypothetical protein
MKIKMIFHLILFYLYRAWYMYNVKYNSAREHHDKNSKTSRDSYLDLRITIFIKTFLITYCDPVPLMTS